MLHRLHHCVVSTSNPPVLSTDKFGGLFKDGGPLFQGHRVPLPGCLLTLLHCLFHLSLCGVVEGESLCGVVWLRWRVCVVWLKDKEYV